MNLRGRLTAKKIGEWVEGHYDYKEPWARIFAPMHKHTNIYYLCCTCKKKKKWLASQKRVYKREQYTRRIAYIHVNVINTYTCVVCVPTLCITELYLGGMNSWVPFFFFSREKRFKAHSTQEISLPMPKKEEKNIILNLSHITKKTSCTAN